MLRPSAIIAWIGATPSAVAGILTIRLRPVRSARGVPRRGLGAGAVVGQLRGDLDADEAVAAVAVVVQPGEHVAGAVDVGEHQRPVVVDDRTVVGGELAELLVVVGRALDRLLEDRRVRRQAADAAVDAARRAGPT